MANKRIAVIFNTNQLGGAERSCVEQLILVKDKYEISCFIPLLRSKNDSLKSYLRTSGFQDLQDFSFPAFIYQTSRKDWWKIPLIIFWIPSLCAVLLRWHLLFKKFEVFYINGNKASFPIFFWKMIFRKKIKVFWHFRDYPSKSFFSIIKKCLHFANLDNGVIDFKLIANSEDVQASVRKIFPNYPIQTIYNLPGVIEPKKPKRIEIIGIVSMLAPWKGQHEIILMAALFQKELKNLGIKKILVYGKNIYQTDGFHLNYEDEIKELVRKLDSDLIEFKGNEDPKKIYAEIDLLIHSSLEPEPFGRVIIEAQKGKIPVISSALGGAEELIKQDQYGQRFICYDYHGILRKIKYLTENTDACKELVESAYQRSLVIETEIKQKIGQIL